MKIRIFSERADNSFFRSFLRTFLALFTLSFCLFAAFITLPRESFVSDSLVKILQAKGWVESGFQSQEVHYLGKPIDPDFNYFLIGTATSRSGEKIAPFPFSNTILSAPFVALGLPEGILYFSAFLFWIYLIILHKISNEYLIPIAAMIGTPLLHHFLSFSDVSIAATLVLLGISFLLSERSEFLTANRFFYFYSGVLIGIACWFRPEVIIFTFSFLFSFFVISLSRSKKIEFENSLKGFLFAFGFLILFSAFVIYNSIHYDSLLGPRVASNHSILNFDWLTKISSIRSLLVSGNGRVGFFGYSPWYLFVIGFCIWNWNKILESSRIWILCFITNLTLVCILTPNDSNIDWGSRYFTCSAFIPLLLIKEVIGIKDIKPMFQKFTLAVFGVLILISLNTNQKVIRTMRKISQQLAQIQSEIPWDNSKVFVTHKNHIANTLGMNYFDQTILLLAEPEDLDTIISRNRRLRFVLIEDIFDRSLSEFAKDQLKDRYTISEIKKEDKNPIRITELTPKRLDNRKDRE
ncbi:hypothetical protein JWG45_13655 [Leptospira sp. 201903070]|uniref:Glycosyltransferase RgtA/B/C/D-like domain-containing protein n=1 Tax=Leptospira ainlahdjerensis TaxID=2810033 RepID=A0ABS2UF71_9LEPT|nr:SoxR reducing system RseC family protein [Leptospira ainlahdjerensis]MBM9578198.1 hypothetical protein [Leptospira ainlahdjerensis]